MLQGLLLRRRHVVVAALFSLVWPFCAVSSDECSDTRAYSVGHFSMEFLVEVSNASDARHGDSDAWILDRSAVGDVSSILEEIASKLRVARTDLRIVRGAIGMKSEWCGAMPQLGEPPNLRLRVCRHGVGSNQEEIFSVVFEESVGVVVIPVDSSGSGVERLVVFYNELVDLNTNDPRLKLIEMEEDRRLNDLSRELREATVGAFGSDLGSEMSACR